MTANPRLDYVDSIRGLASIVVFFTHFAAIFFTSDFNSAIGSFSIHHFLYLSWGNIFISGDKAVTMFFLLSGLVIPYTFFKGGSRIRILQSAIWRYFRLAIPVTASVLIIWLFLKLRLMANLPVGLLAPSGWFSGLWQFEPEFSSALKQGMWLSIFKPNSTTFNSFLWTIYYEFIGSMLIYLSILILPKSRLRWCFYPFLISLFLKPHLFPFFIGMILSDLIAHNFRLGLFIFSLYLILFKPEAWAGAILLVFISQIKILQNWLERSRLRFIGKLSFAIYLLHLQVLGSFSAWIFLLLHPFLPHLLVVGINLFLSIPILLLFSNMFFNVIEKPAAHPPNLQKIFTLKEKHQRKLIARK